MQPKSIWIICVVWILLAGFVRGEQLPHGERILDFDSVIEVLGDASLTVSETITVVARQIRIKRGIYRQNQKSLFLYPTLYPTYFSVFLN